MTARHNLRPALAAALFAGASLVLLSGCSSNSAQAFRSNPTTEMDARGESHDEIANNMALTRDTNYRNINNDLGRLFFQGTTKKHHPTPLGNRMLFEAFKELAPYLVELGKLRP